MVRHSVAVHAVGAKVVGGHNSSNTIINYLIFIKSHCQRNLVVAFLRSKLIEKKRMNPIDIKRVDDKHMEIHTKRKMELHTKQNKASQLRENFMKQNESVKIQNQNLHISEEAKTLGAMAASRGADEVEGGQEMKDAVHTADTIISPAVGTARYAANTTKKATDSGAREPCARSFRATLSEF